MIYSKGRILIISKNWELNASNYQFIPFLHLIKINIKKLYDRIIISEKGNLVK